MSYTGYRKLQYTASTEIKVRHIERLEKYGRRENEPIRDEYGRQSYENRNNTNAKR